MKKQVKIQKWLHTVAACLLMAGCTGAQETAEPTFRCMSLQHEDRVLADSVFKEVKMIPLETHEHCLITGIDRICVDDSVMVVFDSRGKQVNVFDSQGRYRAHIRDVGQSGKEYVQVTDMCLDTKRKRIVLSCSIPTKLMFYDYDGKFIANADLPDYYSEIASDGEHIYGLKPGFSKSTCMDVLDMDGHIKHQLDLPDAKYLSIEHEGYSYTVGNGSQLTSNEGNVYLTRNYDNTVYQLKEDTVLIAMQMDFGPYNLPEGVIDQDMTSSEFLTLFQSKAYAATIREVVCTPTSVFCKTNAGLYRGNTETGALYRYQSMGNPAIGTTNKVQSANGQSLIVQVLPCEDFRRVMKIRMEYSGESSIEPPYLELYHRTQDDDNPILLLYKL